MISIQRVCEKMSDKIARELNFEADQRAIINYGLFAIIQTSIAILVGVILGAILGVLVPTLVISLVAVILRKYSGGAHAQTPEGCVVIGSIISVGGALVVSWIPWSTISMVVLGVIIFTTAYYFVWRLAPVDSIAKPIRRVEKKKLLKKRSIFILNIYLIATIVSLLLYLNNSDKKLLLYIASVYVGISWQIFTLTATGHLAMSKMDLLFNKIIKKQKEVI